MGHPDNVRITGVGAELPPAVVTSAEVEERVGLTRAGLEPGWLERVTGVRERRWATPEVMPSALAAAAGRQALTQAVVDPLALDALLYAGITRDFEEDVATVDRELGTLLDYLDARGLRRRTAIVLTADHGEEFWDHGGLEHGRTLYEEVLRVPLVVAVPGHARASSGDLSTVLDITPTILALAGDAPRHLRGRDLLGDTSTPTAPLPIGQTLFGEQWSGVRAVACKAMRSEHGEERVFDLRTDPHERRNLAAIQIDGHRPCEAPDGAPAASL